jgi:hypothetical protein
MNTKIKILSTVSVVSILLNIYQFTKIRKFKIDDEKKTEVFIKVTDSLENYRMKYNREYQESMK